MSNTEKPDVATVDGNDVESRLSFADAAEKLLRTILVALGYENAGALRGADLITGITAWVTLLITMKREPGGSYASFWARAFLDAWKDMPVLDAAEAATAAVNEFAKRYPPMLDDTVIDEQERDTQSDIQVLTAELDKQVQLVWQLESERNALLKANEHHAGEVVQLRQQLAASESRGDGFDELIGRVWKASALSQEGDLVAQLEYMRNEYDRMNTNEICGAPSRDALVPLAKPERIEPGQRWARVDVVVGLVDDNGTERVDFKTTAYAPYAGALLNRKNDTVWYYLGTDKV